MSEITLTKSAIIGIFAGILGTIVMDLVMVITFLLLQMPIDTFIIIIGDAATLLLTNLGLTIPLTTPLILAMHYLMGSTITLILGLIIIKISLFRDDPIKKGIGLLVLVTEIICVAFFLPILLTMAAAEMQQFLALTMFFHLIYALAAGGFISYNIRHK